MNKQTRWKKRTKWTYKVLKIYKQNEQTNNEQPNKNQANNEQPNKMTKQTNNTQPKDFIQRASELKWLSRSFCNGPVE